MRSLRKRGAGVCTVPATVETLTSANLKGVEVIDHLDYLDGWRGLAIIFLLIGHFFPIPGINFGAVGVNLFFVLSGYLMGQLLFIKEMPLRSFYRRRISRIIPAHVFFILCLLAYFFVAGKFVNWNETLLALFFLNNYFPGELPNAVMPFGHIWSLSVEEHSYIALALVALMVRAKWFEAKWALLGLAVACSTAGLLYWHYYSGRVLYLKFMYTEVNAYGIAISVFLLLLFHRGRKPNIPPIMFPVLFGAGVLAHWWSVPAPIKQTVGVGILALTINLLPFAPSVVKSILSLAPLRKMGIWSFSIYLWQQPFYLALHRDGLPNYVAVLASITCGLASFYFLEQPARAYLNSRPGTTPRTSAAPKTLEKECR